MPDREKVIASLRACARSDATVGCKDAGCTYWDEDRCASKMALDALELLRWQEPVMPVLVPKGRGAGVGYDCGACGAELIVLRGTCDMKIVPEQMRFCRMCGRPVKWDA